MRAGLRRFRQLLFTAVALALTPAVVLASPLSDLPDKGAEAIAYYESDADNWLQGPVSYIVLGDEIDLFENLQTRAERERFIEWFWARRDNDPRDEKNPYKIEFYERVAQANKRYRDFPRGWRSDRGRVHVLLGRPDMIRPRFGRTAEADIWTYYTFGPKAEGRPFGSSFGEISVAFVRTSMRTGYRIYGGFGGPGMLPLYVLDMFRYSKQAAVVDPFLEFRASG